MHDQKSKAGKKGRWRKKGRKTNPPPSPSEFNPTYTKESFREERKYLKLSEGGGRLTFIPFPVFILLLAREKFRRTISFARNKSNRFNYVLYHYPHLSAILHPEEVLFCLFTSSLPIILLAGCRFKVAVYGYSIEHTYFSWGFLLFQFDVQN